MVTCNICKRQHNNHHNELCDRCQGDSIMEYYFGDKDANPKRYTKVGYDLYELKFRYRLANLFLPKFLQFK